MSFDQTINFVTSYGQLIGLSAVVSGIVSALVNYRMNLKSFKKQKQIDYLREKIALYSYLIFQADKMRFEWEAITKLPGNEPIDDEEKYLQPRDAEEVFKKITTKMEDSYSLYGQEILREWLNVSMIFFHPSATESLTKMRTMLINEYNDKILPDYEKITGIKLERKE